MKDLLKQGSRKKHTFRENSSLNSNSVSFKVISQNVRSKDYFFTNMVHRMQTINLF